MPLAELHDKAENVTTRRRESAARVHATITARKGDSMVPDMNLGHSIRALSAGQKNVLGAVFKAFAEHPQTDDEARLVEHVGNNVLKLLLTGEGDHRG